MNKADTCRTNIMPKLKQVHWEDKAILEQGFLTPGRIVPSGSSQHTKEGLRPDHIHYIRRIS